MFKVLVVEDDRQVRKVIIKAVQAKGHVGIQSPHGKHAWETLCHNEDIDLVITDMMMPEMDGRQLIQMIRGNSEFDGLPVLVLSGVADAKQLADLLQLGTTTFLPKPIQVAELQECLEELLHPDG